MSCSAARKISMKVPEVVHTDSRIRVHIATEGPENQSAKDSPSTPCRASGPPGRSGSVRPRFPSTSHTTPRGSANQLGPFTPTHDSIRLTEPLPWKRNRNTVDTAMELVTDGK